MPVTLPTAALALSLSCLLSAQNEISHFGSTAFTSRGGLPSTASVTLLQRLPADQIGGRSAITGFRTTLQLDDTSPALVFSYEVRANLAASVFGSPDVTSPPLASAGPLTFPATTGPTAWLFTVTFVTPIQVPTQLGVPRGDLYSALVLPAALPGSPPLTMHMSVNEPMRPSAVGYTGLTGVAGLAWQAVTGTGPATLTPSNAAWDVRTRFADDVCQPFVRIGTANHFGYGGLFPDTANGYAPGWRVRATAPVGSPVLLVISPSLLPSPLPVAGVRGLLSIDPTRAIVLPGGATVAGNTLPPGTSQALIGPFAVVLTGGVNVFAQALTIDLSSLQASLGTACRMNF